MLWSWVADDFGKGARTAVRTCSQLRFKNNGKDAEGTPDVLVAGFD